MLNKLWLSFFILAGISVLYQGLFFDNFIIINTVISAIFEMAKLSVEIAIGLIGVLAFWCGLLKVAEVSGLANVLAKALNPLFSRLMPEVPKGDPSLGFVTMNMASNMLGLDNAATPMGLKAMESLQKLNPLKDTASNAQILFLVLNTSSVTIFPITIIMYRTQQGASSPSEIFIPILLATIASTLIGLISVMVMQRIRLDRVIAGYVSGLIALAGVIALGFSQFNSEQMALYSATVGNSLLFTAIISILWVAHRKQIEVYDTFVEGAKEGFEIAVKIIPYLVAMLVAIGVLRASGAFSAILDGIRRVVSSIGLDTQFVDALPTALMRPFSASGSRAMMLETMSTHGVDSFQAKLAAIVQGSTETTFYVLTVYFGCVGIKKVRHAIGCGLTADLAGIIAAIFVAYWFF